LALFDLPNAVITMNTGHHMLISAPCAIASGAQLMGFHTVSNENRFLTPERPVFMDL
jgi:hypothetical protein